MVKGHGVHRAELAQVVFEGHVVPVPRHDVKRGEAAAPHR